MGKKTFQVAMIGISESERNILRNIFKLSQYRNYTYIVAIPGELTDILIVDADDPQAMGEWRQAKGGAATGGSTSYRSNIPTIMVTHDLRLVDYCDKVYLMEDGVLREKQ